MFDFAVVIPTVLRPELLRASRSAIEQGIDASINLVIGVDYRLGDPAVLDAVRRLETPRRRVTIVDPGYSTAATRGGFFRNRHGGSLRTALSFLANARHLAFLDDDNWHAPNHLETLARAIEGKAWAFSLRYFCDSRTAEPLAIDRIESLGPGKGAHAARYGGFCNTSTLLLDTQATFEALPRWSQGVAQDGRGPDRSVFEALRALPYGETDLATAYYWMQHSDINHPTRLNWLRSIGATPSLPMAFAEAAARLGAVLAIDDTARPEGPAILANLLRQAKAEHIVLIGAPQAGLTAFIGAALKPLGIVPTLMRIEPPQTLDAAQFLRENEVLADFIYVQDLGANDAGDLLSALWVALRRNGVLLGAGYDSRHPALVEAADRFAFERAATLVPCGTAQARHFLIQRV